VQQQAVTASKGGGRIPGAAASPWQDTDASPLCHAFLCAVLIDEDLCRHEGYSACCGSA
jgi:hypothetical protein